MTVAVVCAARAAAGQETAPGTLPQLPSRPPARAVVVVDAGMDAVRAVVDDAVRGRALLRRVGAPRDVVYVATPEPDGGRRFVGMAEEIRADIEVRPAVGDKRAVVAVELSLPFEDDATERRRAARLATLVRERAQAEWRPPPPPRLRSTRPYGWQIALADVGGMASVVTAAAASLAVRDPWLGVVFGTQALLTGPVVHLAHVRPLAALGSFGLRLLLTGAFAGWFAVADAATDDTGRASYLAISAGLGTGYLAASLLDVFWLARAPASSP